jgi:hypothetical protein
MRHVEYELQGKDVPTELRGKVLKLRVPETLAEGEAMCRDGQEGVLAKFADGRIITVQGILRNRSAKALKDANGDVDKALATLQGIEDAHQYAIQREGSGPSKPKTAQGRQTKAAASSGNRLFEKCLADETFLARMVKQQIVDQAEFDDWKAARAEAEAAKTAPATPATA